MTIGSESVSNLNICFSTPNVRLMFVGTICFAGNANRGVRVRRDFLKSLNIPWLVQIIDPTYSMVYIIVLSVFAFFVFV